MRLIAFSLLRQFDEEYKPTRLRNWEVPNWFPDKPCTNRGSTRIVANDTGNLLPGVPRSTKSPWGDFLSTWHLPKRISRELGMLLPKLVMDSQH